MPRPRYALIWLFAAVMLRAALGQSALGQSPLAPQAGILVLRNGQVLEGEVTRAGDYYIVSKGAGSEVRPKADDVEMFCASLVEAYEFKTRHLSGSSGKAQLELAKWCLRHGLFAQCSEQLDAARRLEPDNPQIKDVQTRLTLAVEAVPPSSPASTTTATVTAEELEQTIRGLPKASVEKFGAIVQPILLNRCGANQCHGPNAHSEFRLLRPPQGQIVSRRFTQRNLYAAVKYLDPSNPEASPLVVMPQQRHGTSLAAVFDKQSANQLAELLAWVKMTMAVPPGSPPAAPASIVPAEMTLSQPAATGSSTGSRAITAAQAINGQLDPGAAIGVHAMRPSLDSPGASPPATAPRLPAPRDRYDPAIFNQRYHGK
jgi:hypothetical protein